jgi:hypothetical protein
MGGVLPDTAAGADWPRVSRVYRKGDLEAWVALSDGRGSPTLSAAWKAGQQVTRRTPGHAFKTVELVGRPGTLYRQLSPDYADLCLLVANRFLLETTGAKLSSHALEDLLKALPLDRLDALAAKP